MQKNILWRKITLFALVAILCLQMLVFFPINAHAEGTEITSYDDTAIEDDLSNIDLSNYPEDSLGECDIISFMEYCYSEDDYYASVYGLYVYVYNPTRKAISVSQGSNYVNALVDFDGSGNKIFENVYLEYLDKSDDNLFYKFKLSNSSQFFAMQRSYSEKHEGIRHYEIIDLAIKHVTGSKTSNVSKVYEWRGYASFCDADGSPNSTLTCKDYGARSIYLNLMQTNYRSSVVEKYCCDELNSVFFTIPGEYFEEFGNLSEIKAQWYEYKTDYVFVTSNMDAYRDLWDMRNVRINEYGQLVDQNDNKIDEDTQTYWRVFFEETKQLNSLTNVFEIIFDNGYNARCRDVFTGINNNWNATEGVYYKLNESFNHIKQIDWLFFSEDTFEDNAYCITKEEVMEYMRNYTNLFPEQERIRGKYATELFTDSIDEDRKQFLTAEGATSGLVKQVFSIEDGGIDAGFDFTVQTGEKPWWSGLYEWWYGKDYEVSSKDVGYSPIEMIKESDLVLDADVFASLYYINKNDVEDIMKATREAYRNGDVPVLLRFALTDYYAASARFDFAEDIYMNMAGSHKNGYVAQETVFLDFDVLSLTFADEEGYETAVIGVVAEPIDIINGFTPPADLVEDQAWWQKIMMVLLLLVLLGFLSPVLTPIFTVVFGFLGGVFKKAFGVIFGFLWKVLTAPVRFTAWVFRRRK